MRFYCAIVVNSDQFLTHLFISDVLLSLSLHSSSSHLLSLPVRRFRGKIFFPRISSLIQRGSFQLEKQSFSENCYFFLCFCTYTYLRQCLRIYVFVFVYLRVSECMCIRFTRGSQKWPQQANSISCNCYWPRSENLVPSPPPPASLIFSFPRLPYTEMFILLDFSIISPFLDFCVNFFSFRKCDNHEKMT